MTSETPLTREEAKQLILPFAAFLNVVSNGLISSAPIDEYRMSGAIGGHHCFHHRLDHSLFAGREILFHQQLAMLLRSSQARHSGPILIDVERTMYMGYRLGNASATLGVLVPHSADRQACRDQIDALLSYMLRRRRLSPLSRFDRNSWLIHEEPQPRAQEQSVA